MEAYRSAIRILEEEYGITSLEELQNAIRKIGPIDVSLFCADIEPEKRRTRHEKK